MIGLSAVDLAIAAGVAIVSYVAMSIALRFARAAAARISAHGSLHAAGSAAGAVDEILAGTSRRLMALTAVLIGISTLQLAEPWATRLSHLWFLTLMLQVALWANRAVTLGPADALTCDTLGVVYSQANAYAKAAGMFRRVVELAPPGAHAGQGSDDCTGTVGVAAGGDDLLDRRPKIARLSEPTK